MNRHGPLLVLALVLAALAAGLAVLFQLRLGRGDVFPAYSSLRADPLGTRALHDSLEALPGFHVERRTKPLTTLEPSPPRLIVLAGFQAEDWTRVTPEEFNALDGAVRAGSRLVLAMRAHAYSDEEAGEQRDAAERQKENAARRREARAPKVAYIDLRKWWGVALKERTWTEAQPEPVRRTPVADATLPGAVGWRSDLYFQPQAGVEWSVLYRRGPEPVLLERKLERGSIVLAGDAFFLSNEALQRERPTALLTWLVGPYTRVVFDESHLGVVAKPGIAALARRYGLAAAGGTFLLLAVLFVWRRMALFVPPPPEVAEIALTYHPAAGLEALLRRATPADGLAAACAEEWKRTARPADVARVEAALAAAPEDSPAVERYNAATRALRRR